MLLEKIHLQFDDIYRIQDIFRNNPETCYCLDDVIGFLNNQRINNNLKPLSKSTIQKHLRKISTENYFIRKKKVNKYWYYFYEPKQMMEEEE